MKKTIRKIFSVLVAVCLCTSMVPATAMAAQSDKDFLDDQKPENIGPGKPGGVGGTETPGDDWGNVGWTHGNTAQGTTDVFVLPYDTKFGFSSQSKNMNFKDTDEAIANTAAGATPGPLFGVFGGDEGEFEYTWSLEDVTVEADGSYTYSAHAPLPTFSGPQGTSATGGSGTFGTTDAPGTKVKATFGEGTRFEHSITAADGLAKDKLYRYTLTISDPSASMNREPITASILVSIYGDYESTKLYLNEDQTNGTSVEGFIYRNLTTAPLLNSQDIPASSSVYGALADAAASKSPVQSITQPQQLVITNIENLPEGEPVYKLDLNVHLGLPSNLEGVVEQGDTVTVYRYDQKTGTVQEYEGTVVQQTDLNGNPVVVDGKPVLSVEFRISGTSSALGAFAIGYENPDGSFTVTSEASAGGSIAPAGEQTFAVGASPAFVLNAQAGYQLASVSLECDGSPVSVVGGTLVGNLFTLSADDYGMSDGEHWTVTGIFEQPEPGQDAYSVSAHLTGAGSGHMDVVSGAAGALPYRVYMNDSIPATGDDAIMMSSRDGVYLDFWPGDGYRVKSLKINNQPYTVVGTSYFIGVLTANVSIEVEYEEGMPDPTITRTIQASVDDPSKGGIWDAASGTYAPSATITVNQGSTGTVSIQPQPGQMVASAMVYTGDSTDGVEMVRQVTQADDLFNLQVRNVLEDTRVVVSFKSVDGTVTIKVASNGTSVPGGTVNPVGNVKLAAGVPQQVTVTPDATSADGLGYVLGSITMNGVNIQDYLTSRNGGKYYTFVIVRADAPSADYGKLPGGLTDKVLLIPSGDATIEVAFNPKTPPAPSYQTITTEVAEPGGGTVTPTQRVEAGRDAEVWFFPDEGKRVKSVTLDGRNVTSTLDEDGGRLLLEKVQTDHTVVVAFEDGDSALTGKKTYTIHPSAGSGGAITPADDVKVYEGKSQTFNFFPSTNYNFSKVILDGKDLYDKDSQDADAGMTATSYVMKDVRADHNLVVTFEKSASAGTERDSYTVDISAGEHGSVSPQGSHSVARGSNFPISVFPDAGYMVDEVIVATKSGVAAGIGGVNKRENLVNGVYTEYDVQDDLIITVTFKEGEDPDQPSTDINNMILLGSRNAEIDPGLIVTPPMEGLKYYKEAGTDHANVSQDFTIAVASGYALADVQVNGKPLSVIEVGDGTYKIVVPKEEIYTRMILKVTSKEQPPSTQVVDLRTITVTWTGNGSVSPSGITKGVVRVETGQSQTFNFIPERGNRVDSVLVNGSSVTLDDFTYTIESVTQDMRIEATFVEDPNAPEPPQTGEVSVKLGVQDDGKPHGFASVGEGLSAAKVVVGKPLSISFKPDSGYETHVFEGSNASGTEVTAQLSNGTLHIPSVPAAGKKYYVEFRPLTQPVAYQTVTASSSDKGKISPEGTVTVVNGSDMTFTLIPDSGCTIENLWVTRDGQSVDVADEVRNSADFTYTLTKIEGKVDLYARFKQGPPDDSGHSVRTVTASTSAGGTVSPTSMQVATGSTATLTFIPLRGYALKSVIATPKNGADKDVTEQVKGNKGVYAFAVTADTSVYAEFEKSAESNPEANMHDVFLRVGDAGGGQVSPGGVVSVPHGGSLGFTMIPDDGFKVDSINIYIGGIKQTDPQFTGIKYALFNVTAEMEVVVNFKRLDPGESITIPNIYEIKATSSFDGSISPSGTIKVAEGGMSLFSFQPHDGYRLSYLVVDGEYKTTADIVRGQYTFVGVNANHTIHAVFCPADEDPADFVTVTAGTPSGGSITPAGSKLFMKGTDAKYTISAFFGYTLTDIRVNDESIFADGADGTKNVAPVNNAKVSWSNSTLTLKNVQADASITASFRQKDTSPEEPAVEYSRITVKNSGHGTVSYNTGTTVIEALKDGQELNVSIIPDEGYAIGSLNVVAANGENITLDGGDNASAEVNAKLKDIWREGYITLSAAQVNYEVTISVTFREQTQQEKDDIDNGTFTPAGFRTINAQAFGRGTITPHGVIRVAQNASATFSMVPMQGYELSALRIDGKDAMNALSGSRTYTFNPGGAKERSIEATFSQLASGDQGVTYKVRTAIDAQNGSKGFASVEEMEVAAGGSATLYFWPEVRDDAAGITGSKLTSLSVVTRDKDGNVVEDLNFAYNIPEYVLSDISGDTTVTAHFDLLGPDETTWTVTEAYVEASVSSDGGGRVSPATATVPKGCEQTFNFFPDGNNEVSFLRVNDEIVYVDANIRSYSMIVDSTDKAQPNTLEVTYKNASNESSDVTVTAKVEAKVDFGTSGGSAEVWPAERTIPAATPATFYVKPQEGYTINKVTVDGVEVPFEGVGEAEAGDFHPGPFDWTTVHAKQASGERLAAVQGGTFAGDISTNVSTALYTGGANVVAAANAYEPAFYSVYRITIPNVTHDITANVNLIEINQKCPGGNYYFVESPTYKVEVTSEGGGTVSPVGVGFLPEGDAENIRLRTFTGYYLESVICTYADGTTEDMTSRVVGNNLQVRMGKQDMKIHAKFTPVGQASFVDVSLGEALDPWGNPIAIGDVGVSPSLPGQFVRDVDGTGGGTQFFFTPPHQDTNDPKWVLDYVEYNGKRVPFIPDSNYVNVKLTAGGEFKIKFRELEEGHEIIEPTTYKVTGKVTAGQGTIMEGPYPVSAGSSLKVGFQPAEGWMLDTENCFDWYADEEGGQMVAHKIPADKLADGAYVLKGVDRDHEITVAFVQFVDLTIGWTNGDNGYVTPNTMNGDAIKVKKGESIPFIVAPYEGYDVESVMETVAGVDTNVTGKLRQSAATTQQLLAMPGHESFTVKHTQEGMGVTGPVRDSDAQPQSLEPVVQAANPANGVLYAAAPTAPSSSAQALQNFNFAYGAQTAPISNDTAVMATWTHEDNVVKKEERTISVEIVGNMGGTVEPMVGKGVDDEYITFSFIPDDGFAVRYLEVSRGGKVDRYESDSAGGKEEYAYGPIEGDGYIKVGFDSIANPGANDTLSRMLRTLKSLAQTGDLTAPVIGTLLGVAVLAAIMAFVTSRRRRKKA